MKKKVLFIKEKIIKKRQFNYEYNTTKQYLFIELFIKKYVFKLCII